MSVIVAVKKDDAIYMGADTQATSSSLKYKTLIETSYKIKVINNDLLVGIVGNAKVGQFICSHSEFFKFDETKGLTKEVLVRDIVPQIYLCLKENKLLEDDEEQKDDYSFPCELILAFKDKLFKINDKFVVTNINKFVSIGIGEDFVNYALYNIDYKKEINEQLKQAMKISGKYCPGIGAPFIFINTKDLTFTKEED